MPSGRFSVMVARGAREAHSCRSGHSGSTHLIFRDVFMTASPKGRLACLERLSAEVVSVQLDEISVAPRRHALHKRRDLCDFPNFSAALATALSPS